MIKVAWSTLLEFLESDDGWQKAGQESPRSTLKIKIAESDVAGSCRTDTRMSVDKDLVIDFDTKGRVLNVELI